MTHDTIKSLIEAAIDSCEAIDIGSFFPKVTFKNTRPVPLNKSLFASQDKISSPRVEKVRQKIQAPPNDIFAFSIPFVYPTVEDVCQQESAILYDRKVPISCTQAFEDNFDSVNLTQMLDETRFYGLSNQDPSRSDVALPSRNTQPESSSTLVIENGVKETNYVLENTKLVTEPPEGYDASLQHVEKKTCILASPSEISRYHTGTKSCVHSGLQPSSTTIHEYSPLNDITMGSINPSPSVTGFCTGKGVSISISSAASLQRAKGLITECFNETNGECINKELQSIVPETAVPQDLIKTACSLKVDICIASSVQSSESSDVGHDLPPNVYLPVTYANRNAGLTGSLVTDGASATDLKPSDSLHPAKDIPEACAHEPVLSSGSTRIRPCQASQSLPCSESLGSLKSTGFQTGKGVSISVKSKEALIRAKNLFADSLDEPVGPLDKRTVHKSSHNTLLTLKESQLLPERSKASFVTGFLEGKAGSNALTTKRLCRPKSLVGDSRIEPVGVQTTAPIHPYTSLKADVKNPAPFKDQPLPDASPASIITGFSTGKGTPISLASTEVPKRVRDLLKGCLNDPLLDWCQKPIENCITPLAKNVLEMPSQTNDVHRSNVFSTHNQITVHYMDAALPSDFKSNLISQNARKFTSVLPLNASPQGPTSSAVFCAEVVGTDSSADHGSTSNAKIYLQAEPTAPSADACALPSSSCFPPEEQTDGEIPRKPQSPRFDCGEPLASVFETNSLADTNHASSPRNVTPSKSIKNRALARNLQETMAIAKFKSHATPSPKAARSHADDRTLLASSVAASRGQPHKIVREPISPGLLWRLRHRFSISSTLLNTCCLPEQVSPLNEGFVLPDCLELPKEVSSWSLSTARRLLFRLDTSNSEEFPLSYNLGDGVEVIPNDSGLAGVEEVGRAFVCSPGVTAGLASRTWVNHHFTQLAWRFGSCAILQPNRLRDSLAKFPVDAQSTVEPGGSNLLGCWLLHALLLELKYRYDKELEAVERSALRKILETDDTPAKRMVLCVSQLQPLQNSMYRGRLTDGWYHMDWLPDKALAQLISSGRIRVGTKLVCAGAEAVQRPAGLDPQDSGNTDVQKDVDSHLFGASSGLILRLGANSTRMAHPTARLGYVPTSPNHITSLCPIPLSSLHADGGPVSSILVLVQRRFQLQFMETRSEDSENERKHRIFRDPRSEEAASREHERNCQVAFDKAAGDFSSSPKCSKRLRRSQPTSESLASLGLDGEALWNAINGAPDPDLAEASLSTVQRDAVLHFKESTLRELLTQTVPKREVTPLLRLHLAGLHPKDVERKLELPLTLWNPPEEMLSTLKEGAVVQFFRLQISTTRVNDPFAPTLAVPMSAKASGTELPTSAQLLSLSGGRSTAFRLIPKKAILKFCSSRKIHGPSSSQSVGDLVEKVFRPRVVHSLTDLPKFAPNSSTSTLASSSVTDFSALVVGVYKTSMPSLNSAEVTGSDLSIVYLAHQNEDDSSTMGVLRVWGGLERYCLGSVLRLGNKITFTDVQVRGCCVFRPQHDFSPDSCELRLVNLNYTAASYAVVAGSLGLGSFRQLRTPRQESSNFTTFMRACAEAHFERSFSRSLIFTPAVKPTALTASRTISASTPIQRRSGNHQAPSSATTTAAAVRSLSTLLRGDLASAASAVTPCKSKTLETPTSPGSVTPRPCRTRTGLSRPRSSRQTLSTTTYSAASALTTVTTAGSNCMRTRLRASQEAVDPIPPTVMSSGPAHNGPVEQTPVRRVAKQKEAPTSPSGQSSPSFLGSNFTATTAEALDDLNVSIADLVKTRRRSSSLLASPPSAGSPQCSSYPRTPRSRRKPSPRLTSPSVDAV